jgi:hypothetical protein
MALLTLHLGVLEQPYRARGKGITALTTGDVAEILEAEYGLFEVFYEKHKDDVAGALADSIEGALESLLMGQLVQPHAGGMQKIQQMFRDFITSYEAERVGIPGTPTKAALSGVNHRFKHPYKNSNPRRPSFRDTGLLMNSFRAWVE